MISRRQQSPRSSAPVAEWLPTLARMLGAEQLVQAPRLAAGEAGVVLMTEIRGACNAKAKRAFGVAAGASGLAAGFAP